MGARDFSSAVSGYSDPQLRPSANTENSHRTRENSSGTQGSVYSKKAD